MTRVVRMVAMMPAMMGLMVRVMTTVMALLPIMMLSTVSSCMPRIRRRREH